MPVAGRKGGRGGTGAVHLLPTRGSSRAKGRHCSAEPSASIREMESGHGDRKLRSLSCLNEASAHHCQHCYGLAAQLGDSRPLGWQGGERELRKARESERTG